LAPSVRAAPRNTPGQALGNVPHWHAGADCVNRPSITRFVALATKRVFGWPTSDAVEKEVTAWFDAKNLEEGRCGQRSTSGARRRHLMRRPALPELHRVAQERLGIAKGPVAVLLGRVEKRMTAGKRICSLYPAAHSLDPACGWAMLALFVFSLLYIARAIRRGDRRRPGRAPADVEPDTQSLASNRPFLVQFGSWVWDIVHGISAPRSSPICRSQDDRATHRADALVMAITLC